MTLLAAQLEHHSPIPQHESAALRSFYDSAWGRQWTPLNNIRVIATPPGSLPGHIDDDAPVINIATSTLELEPGTPLDQTYTCYGSLHTLFLALGLAEDHFGEEGVLVVRPEYELLRERLMSGDLERFERVVVTGHPGIGKTMCMLYILLYRLHRKLPTAIEVRSGEFTIFDGQGCTTYTNQISASSAAHERLKACWALSDSNAHVTIPSISFVSRAARVVQFTSPEEKRWKGWSKEWGAVLVIMDLPTMLDIAAVAHAYSHSPTEALTLASEFGPSLRTLQSLLDGHLYLASLRSQIQDQTQLLCSDAHLASSLSGFNLIEPDHEKVDALVYLRPLRRWRSAGQELRTDEGHIVIRAGEDGVLVEKRWMAEYCIPSHSQRENVKDVERGLSTGTSSQLSRALGSLTTHNVDGPWP
ncbi:unnamed protein product [Peniophora sp. CBMAI 1063]|nr:unnamed protein product [Peniophora sp. CBMAI 1063]